MQDAPKCPACNQWMQVKERVIRLTVYECCGITKTRPREEYEQGIGDPGNDWRKR